MWVSGYQPIDPESGRFLGRDAPELAERGVLVCAAAGAGRHHAEALAAEEASPGRPLVLRRDTENEHDANAVAIDLPGGEQVGWVPRELAALVAPHLDAGEVWSAVSLRELRRSPRDPRAGLTIAAAPAAAIELRVHPARPPR